MMSTSTKFLLVIVVVAAMGFGFYQFWQASKLRNQVGTLQQQQREQAAELSDKVQKAEKERADALALASAPATPAPVAPAPRGSNEVLRLRGEVGRLRMENATLGATNAISKVTANPEARKMLRDAQKMGMGMIYRGLAKTANLSTEQSEKLNDVLADWVMDNVDRVTTVLRDKPSPDQLNRIFDAEEAALQDKVKEMMGDEGLSKFREYSTGLLGSITADQFKGMLSGDEPSRQAKAKQLAELIQQESQKALAEAGLPADYQTIPMLNFRNIASEQEGERSVKLLDDIYQRVAAHGATFLAPEELKKFDEFRQTGVKNNKAMLTLNRTMMAPISE